MKSERFGKSGPTTIVALAIVLASSMFAAFSEAQTFQTLHMFNGGTDGSTPMAGLMLDPKGNLYGATEYGGLTTCSSNGCGTVFRLNPRTNKYAVLHRFDALKEGYDPIAGLVRDPSTNTLYGITRGNGYGAGQTIFQLDSLNRFKTLYAFTGKNDGIDPQGGLLWDPVKHSLWGTTQSGVGKSGWGTIFEVSALSGRETSLYSFPGQPNGAMPQCTLISVRGSFFGTTLLGGAGNNGMVFTGAGNVIYSFNTSEFRGPYPGLAPGGPAGNPVGVTPTGGDHGQGMVYGFNNAGQFITLYSFQLGTGDGQHPEASVVIDKASNIYGTTNDGGTSGVGTIFKVDKTGKETILHNFTGYSDGSCPCSNLILDSKGKLYGTASTGGNLSCGTTGCGTVFEITP
jgi:uncharacterized repeat protein (TIGR03803 family)